MRLATLSPREASIFACVCDTVVAPEPVLPPVTETNAVRFFDLWLTRAPRPNRIGLRALLYAAELAPRVVGFNQRLRALPKPERARALERIEGAGPALVRQLVTLIEGMAKLAYYSDDRVSLRLGYNADANLARARELRRAEARP